MHNFRRIKRKSDGDVYYNVNIYDTRQIRCYKCNKFIGEIVYDAEVTMPLCGQCANPMPEGDDKIMYTASKYKLKKPITA